MDTEIHHHNFNGSVCDCGVTKAEFVTQLHERAIEIRKAREAQFDNAWADVEKAFAE